MPRTKTEPKIYQIVEREYDFCVYEVDKWRRKRFIGNYAAKELAQTKINALTKMAEQIHPVKRLSRDEVVDLLGAKTFPKRKRLPRKEQHNELLR